MAITTTELIKLIVFVLVYIGVAVLNFSLCEGSEFKYIDDSAARLTVYKATGFVPKALDKKYTILSVAHTKQILKGCDPMVERWVKNLWECNHRAEFLKAAVKKDFYVLACDIGIEANLFTVLVLIKPIGLDVGHTLLGIITSDGLVLFEPMSRNVVRLDDNIKIVDVY